MLGFQLSLQFHLRDDCIALTTKRHDKFKINISIFYVNSGLNVKIDEPEVYPVQIQGPKSQKVLQKLCGDEILNVRYYWTLTTNLEGNIPVVISRTGWTGEVGYEITLRDASKGTQLWNLIMEAGKEFKITRMCKTCQNNFHRYFTWLEKHHNYKYKKYKKTKNI